MSHAWRCVLLGAILSQFLLSTGQTPQDDLLKQFEVKNCKHTILPSSLNSRAYTTYTGEVHVHDVFGIPSTIKRHTMQLSVATDSLLTFQAEVHRDTPTTLTVDIFRRGESRKGGRRVILGKNMLGAGGEDTKCFLHGLLGEKDHEVAIVFNLVSIELAASQVDSKVQEAKCWPIRVDLTAVPTSRAALHWPTACPAEDKLPKELSSGNERIILGDSPVALAPSDGQHFVFRFADERPWTGFQRSLWSGSLEVPTRLHRFVRIFLRTSFRFASSPLQLVIELFDLKDVPDASVEVPKCALGCLGGVPVHNGQMVDHAMPTGFRYKLWLLAASMSEWTEALPEKGRHCLEFDFEYSVKFEAKLTPFEVGPSAWMCESARLPKKIVQSPNQLPTDKLEGSSDGGEYVYGRSIWVRDRFGMPPDEVEDMEHNLDIDISEPCVFRASTHHSDGVDVSMRFSVQGDDSGKSQCQTIKHPGPVPRITIFCLLQPGKYVLTFFADYPLGGLHPCSDFFAQVSLRPTALTDEQSKQKCLTQISDMQGLQVQRSMSVTTKPRWTAIRVPINFGSKPATTSVWNQQLTITPEDAAKKLYLRMVLHSDYISSDLRFQVQFEGRYVADNQVTAHGYADMIGPLDAGKYKLWMYYVVGVGAPEKFQLCSNSMVDLRLVSESQYKDRSEEWLCTSSRVPPPDSLAPQREEQVLLDSEYLIPLSGKLTMGIKVEDGRLLRVKATSADADFGYKVTSSDTKMTLSRVKEGIEVVLDPGSYLLTLDVRSNPLRPVSACSTYALNLLLAPRNMLPLCPWAPSSSDQSAASEAQRQANDHIGTVLVDLMPQKLSTDINVKKPVTLWMSQGMEKMVDFTVDSTAAVRVDVSVQPPFLPLELILKKKEDTGKLEAPMATAEWTENRLLLMYNDLPPGQYVVSFVQPRSYMAFSDAAKQDLTNLCAHLTISAEVGLSSKEAVNNMRSELLDIPDLLAVQPFPSSMNMIGWLSNGMLASVGTQVFRFQDTTNKAQLKLEEKAVLRIVSEPADLSNADIDLLLSQNGQEVARSDNLGQLIAEASAGSYDLVATPKAKAPFLMTLGMSYESRLRQDMVMSDSGAPCVDTFPDLASGVNFGASSWSIGPKFLRLGSRFLGMQGKLTAIPVSVSVASVMYLEVGSSLPLDLIRIALQVPEGLWIGEQRGYRNSLEIELPPGKYTVEISQPKPSHLIEDIKRCQDFSVFIRTTPTNPDAKADEKEATSKTGQEMASQEEEAVDTASCFSMGTVPLPLDFSSAQGGSATLGGPIDQAGRLLIRANVMLTDMHDGRKKVFISTGGQRVQLKLGVILGGYSRLSLASQVAFTATSAGDKSQLTQIITWNMDDGWERVYILEAQSQYWLAFHHAHRERSESACLHFGLMLEAHPTSDTAQMMECSGNSVSPEDMFPGSLNLQNDGMFKYSKERSFLSQRQRGFLTNTRFTLTTSSWVGVQVGFNFFLSHAEMDIVLAEDRPGAKAMVPSELEPRGAAGSIMDARLVIGVVLPPGEYKLRVADDHYKGQLDGSAQGCFPFSFDFTVVPESSIPGVLSVHPHPSVPLVRGVDVVLSVRFSEPPQGSIDDVVSKFSFGGIQAVKGGSVNHLESNFADAYKRKSIVQATASEGHKVWVIGWSGQALASLSSAKLVLSELRGNTSGQIFKFNPPTYSFVDAPKGAPWSGGAEGNLQVQTLSAQQVSVPSEVGSISSGSSGQSSTAVEVGSVSGGSSAQSSNAGEVGSVSGGSAGQSNAESEVGSVSGGAYAQSSSIGAVGSASSSGTVQSNSAGIGEMHVEGGSEVRVESDSAPPAPPPNPAPPPPISVDEGEIHIETGEHSQQASVNPRPISATEDGEIRIEGGSSPSPPPAFVGQAIEIAARASSDLPKVEEWDPLGDSSKGTKTKKSASQTTESNTPTGHQLVVLMSLGSVALVGIAFLFPSLRRGDDRQMRMRRGQGPYSAAEEIGLVSRFGDSPDDDDML